jgi:hypothetical protein
MLMFASDEELVVSSFPFISDGIADGDLVIVRAEHDVDVLRRAFDDDPRVKFAPGTDRYQRMMTTIGEYQRLCERENHAGRRVRATGPVPFPEDPLLRAEWMRYKALVERALGPYGFSGLCRNDTRSTPPDVLDLALATHQQGHHRRRRMPQRTCP